MHITILALGSLGDVLPLAALGEGLQDAGHQVLLATFENFQEIVDQYGLDFLPIRGNSKTLMLSNGGFKLAGGGRNPFKTWTGVQQSFGSMAAGYAEDFTPLLNRQTDCIINQLPGGLFGLDLSEKMHIPMVLAGVIPLARTRTHPMLAFPKLGSFLPGYNLLTHRIAEQLVWFAFRSIVNRWRKEVLHLPPQPFWGRFQELGTKRYPIVYGFSSQIVPRPRDWGNHIHLTGYWLPKTPLWHPPGDLVTFIKDGPPPVFIGFGSMPLQDPDRTWGIVMEALNQVNFRAVVHSGWAGFHSENLPGSVYPLAFAPYAWLFPQMAALIHHGGSGTTAHGLYSGVPSLVVPFVFDQYYWGQRLHMLGAGPAPQPVKHITVGSLTDALHRMVSDSSMSQKAAALGNQLQAEDGIKQAVAIIEHFVEQNSG